MNALEGIVKVIIFLVFILGVIVGAFGDEAFRWIADQINGSPYA